MASTPPLLRFPPGSAVLLVLLPIVTGTARLAQAATVAALTELQVQLGTLIQVLRVDEATHPDVVHSFDGRGLPAFVLVRQGIELWRQQGLPEGDSIVPLLLSKLRPAPGPAQ